MARSHRESTRPSEIVADNRQQSAEKALLAHRNRCNRSAAGGAP
ncbi:hypothetical protein BURPS305_1178 [Burkholderia pseudomallei 305]|nr:hypothetical protein BURPS305_1178 [Burkholderia pseudomallei 305]EDS87581.1 hypothetical protein BURPSS13_P0175 [Burkholderia pseudomallei S13]